MDWVNTGLYRAFGYNLCYPQVLPHMKWSDATAQSLVLSAGQAGSRKWLAVMNDHMLGESEWLCGDTLTIADYFASGILSLGELIGCNFSPQRGTLVRTDAGFAELEQRQRCALHMGKSHQKPRLRADLSKVNPRRIGRRRRPHREPALRQQVSPGHPAVSTNKAES
jgi:glutathione S-transferase